MGLRYYLPETRIRLSGVIDHITTTFDSKSSSRVSNTVSSGVEWVTLADQHRPGGLSLDGRMLEDRLAKVAFTPDRRLAGASSSSASKVAGFVKSGLSAAVSAVSLIAFQDTGRSEGLPARVAYDKAHRDASNELGSLRDQLAQARAKLTAERRSYVETEPGAVESQHYRRIRHLSAIVDDLEADLSAAVIRFKSWQASKTLTETEMVETLLEMRQLPRWNGTTIDWESAAQTSEGMLDAEAFWEKMGFIVARSAPGRTPVEQAENGAGVCVRLPRLESFALLRRTPIAPHAIVVEQTIHRWVLDDDCDTEFIEFDRSLFGDREVVLEFDADGVLSSLAKTSKSGATSALDSVGAGITGGLSQAQTILETVDGFRNHEAAARRTRLEQELAIAQAEVGLAGLGATRAEAANVARLTQLVEIADAQTVIEGSSTSIIDGLLANNPAATAWLQPRPPTPEPQTVRVEIVNGSTASGS